MPKLPDFQDLGERQTPQPTSNVVSLNTQGGRGTQALASGMVGAGQDLQAASEIVGKTNYRQDQMVAESALNQLQKDRLGMEADERTGFKNVRGAAVVGQQFVDNYQQKFDARAEDIQAGLQNDNQRQMFKQRSAVAALQFKSTLLDHQSRETDRFNDQTENDSIELARRGIFSAPGNPSAYDAGIAQIGWAIDQKAKRLGWSPEVAAVTKAKYMDQVYYDTADMMVEKDAAGTLGAINRRMGIGGDAEPSGIPAIDNLQPDKLVTLRRRAASYVAQADNKNRAEEEKRLREAERAFKELTDFTLTGQMASPEYQQSVKLATVGTPYEQNADSLLQMSYAGAAFGSQPLPAQEAALRRMDASASTQGSSPEQAKVMQSARQITDNQRAAYKENPFAAATRFGRVPEVPEQPINSADQVPQLIASRLGMLSTVETYAGKAVSPLQPGEAAAFADKLKTLPPNLEAEVIGRSGQILTPDRINAMADQVSKHDKVLPLMMYAAGDKTTAGRYAAELIRRGSNALNDKTVKRDDAALTGWKAEISELVNGSIGNAEDEARIKEAAYYIRAAMDSDSSAAPGYSLGSTTKAAVAMVAGAPIERGGVKTLLPRGMKEGEFDDALRKFTPVALAPMAPAGKFYAGGKEVTLEQLSDQLPSMPIKRFGSAGYVPLFNNRPITTDPAGATPLVLKVR